MATEDQDKTLPLDEWDEEWEDDDWDDDSDEVTEADSQPEEAPRPDTQPASMEDSSDADAPIYNEEALSQADTDTPLEAHLPQELLATDGDQPIEDVAPVEGTPDDITPTEAVTADEAFDEPLADDVPDTDEAALALESYRGSVEDTSAELADVSAFKNFRRTTKTESKKSKPVKSDLDVFANRRKAKTIAGAVAQADPILYFYNGCIRKDGTVYAMNVYQVLQDRFMGKLLPQLFLSIAEGSSKIEELNLAQLQTVLAEVPKYPQYKFVLTLSTRFFSKPALLDKLLRQLPESLSGLILAFDCANLHALGVAGKAGVGALRERGAEVLLDSTEKISMTALTELDYDYIRFDSRFYELGNPRADAYLSMVIALCREQGIGTIATFCDTEDMCEYMFYMGVDAVQGNAISKPMRTVPNAVKSIVLLNSMLEAE